MITEAISPLRQRMIEDMSSRKLGTHTQRSHIHSCKRFAAFLKRSPDTATAEDIRLFQLHLAETGMGICNRNRIMTGVRFLFRVTLRRLDLAAEIYHLREPQKIAQVMSPGRDAEANTPFEKLPGTQINVPRLNLHKRPRHRRCPTSRDFVPWRFSDAGRRPPQRVDSLVMPASENLHTSRHFYCPERDSAWSYLDSSLAKGYPSFCQSANSITTAVTLVKPISLSCLAASVARPPLAHCTYILRFMSTLFG